MENNKEYYTFGEIMYVLRGEYQNSQVLLDKMKENIVVLTAEEYSTDLILRLKDDYDRDYGPFLLFRVSKDINSSIGVRVRDVLNRINHDTYRFNLDNAAFELIDEKTSFSFKPINNSSRFNPQVFIKEASLKDFRKTYEELKKTTLYSLPVFYDEINPFQSLFIWGDSITLTSEDEFGKGIKISYRAKKDKIHIDSSKKYSTCFIEELLLTKIPGYVLPDEYIKLFNEKKDEFDMAFVEDIIGKRKETLSIKDEPKRLILKREIK